MIGTFPLRRPKDKTADLNVVAPNDIVTYTITVQNANKAGNAAAVWVNDTLPSTLTYISDTSGQAPSINGNTYGYVFYNLSGGNQISFDILARVDTSAQDGVDINNLVQVEYTDQFNVSHGDDSDVADSQVQRPHITVSKVANTYFAGPGDTVVYTIYYNNTGSKKANDVWINDTLPYNTTYGSSSAAYN